MQVKELEIDQYEYDYCKMKDKWICSKWGSGYNKNNSIAKTKLWNQDKHGSCRLKTKPYVG
jgi:hypothetical protein